jgi:hypothetical protein
MPLANMLVERFLRIELGVTGAAPILLPHDWHVSSLEAIGPDVVPPSG